MPIDARTVYPATDEAYRMVLRAGPGRHKRLVSWGWTFAESEDVSPANAVTNPYTKQIVFRPLVVRRQSLRDVYYVTEHEVGHALDFAAGKPSRLLSTELRISVPSAQEALAEAVAYWARRSGSEKGWVLASIRWHVRRGKWDYSWKHVRDVRTVELAKMLVYGPGRPPGKFWAWAGNEIVQRP
jgi:hypothetical protein